MKVSNIFSFILNLILSVQVCVAETIPKIEFPELPVSRSGVSPSKLKAKKILERLIGTKVPTDLPLLSEMSALIESGDVMGATKLATNHPLFYSVTVKQLAGEMSTTKLSKTEPLNDFSATLIGIVRDDLDGREFLTGNFQYKLSNQFQVVHPSTRQPISLPEVLHPIDNKNQNPEIEKRNNDYYYFGFPFEYYSFLNYSRYDVSKGLVKVERQKHMARAANYGYTEYFNPDPAGALTSMTFMSEMASDGRNRRMVQYAFSQFLCAPITDWADSSAPDLFVPRDISRFPAGNHLIYQNTCRSCHSVMDGMKQAFNHLESYPAKNKSVTNLKTGNKAGEYDGLAVNTYVTGDVVKKVNDVIIFAGGNINNKTDWYNFATSDRHQAYFGWRGPTSGKTVLEFGSMLANSKRYGQCMAKRIFSNVCMKDVNSDEAQALFEESGVFFEKSNHSFKKLFQYISSHKHCFGE